MAQCMHRELREPLLITASTGVASNRLSLQESDQEEPHQEGVDGSQRSTADSVFATCCNGAWCAAADPRALASCCATASGTGSAGGAGAARESSNHRPCHFSDAMRLAWIIVFTALAPICLAITGTGNSADRKIIAIMVFTVLMWSLRPYRVSTAYVSLACVALLVATRAMRFKAALSGGCTDGLWLIFCGAIFARCLEGTAAVKFLLFYIAEYGNSRMRFLVVLHVFAWISAWFIPSGVVKFLFWKPVIDTLLSDLGYIASTRSPESGALYFSLGMTAYLSSGGLQTGTASNIVLSEQFNGAGVGNQSLSYTTFLRHNAVVFTCVQPFVCFATTYIFFFRKDGGKAFVDFEQRHSRLNYCRVRMSRENRIACIIVSLASVFWVASDWTNVDNATVGFFAVLLLTFPAGLGPFKFEMVENFPVKLLLVVIGIIAIGNAAVVSPLLHQHLQAYAGHILASTHSHFVQLWLIALATIPIRLMGSTPAASVLVVPFCKSCEQHGLNPISCAMSVAMANNALILPYQSGPLLISSTWGYCSFRVFVCWMLVNLTVTCVILFPLCILFYN